MKIELEQIEQENHSFNLMYNPRLSDLFFWHFHPEYELVYIGGCDGHRRVGNHISRYEGSDLVLIGSNIPHLNFDHGVKTDYEKVVVHFNTSFIDEVIHSTPELVRISDLFRRSVHGIAFQGAYKDEIGKALLTFESMDPFSQYLKLMELLNHLLNNCDEEKLHESPYVNPYRNAEQERLRRIYAFTDEHYARKVTLNEVSELCNMSREAFCRYFKKATGQSYLDFLNQYRVTQAKLLLSSGQAVSQVGYQTGFESLSYFSRMFKRLTGESPRMYRDRQFS